MIYKVMIDISKIPTEYILKELLRREHTDSSFELKSESPTSYTFKFYRFD